MKKFLLLFAASLIVGLACFLISYFLFSFATESAFNLGITVAITGLAGEYLRPWLISLEQQQKDMISRRVRKNLKRKR